MYEMREMGSWKMCTDGKSESSFGKALACARCEKIMEDAVIKKHWMKWNG